MTAKQNLGNYGEELAVQYLHRKGYKILATHWHCTRGEIDIIAQFGELLVFIEVKTRRAAQTEPAFASITPRKQARLIASVYHYLHAQGLDDPPWRIDVIGIALPRSGPAIIDHAENALDW